MAATEPAVVGLTAAEALRVRQEAYDNANRAPWWIEYCVSFFPVILFVFALRSFVVEPFRIPSGSMLPTLQRSEEHTSELQSLMRISYAVFCLKKIKSKNIT